MLIFVRFYGSDVSLNDNDVNICQVLRQRRIPKTDVSPERIVAEILVRKVPEDQEAIG